jgi:hypothetical protein
VQASGSRRGNPNADIPVKGGDFVERDGVTYAVLALQRSGREAVAAA